MNNQSISEIRPNFSHRFVDIHENHLDVHDTLNLMTNRALSVLNLLALQFEDDSTTRLNDELLTYAIDTAICEIVDIQSYLRTIKNPR